MQQRLRPNHLKKYVRYVIKYINGTPCSMFALHCTKKLKFQTKETSRQSEYVLNIDNKDNKTEFMF